MESPLKPHLRKDLRIMEQEDGDHLVYVLKDPRTHKFFRLKPLEFQIASQLDGQRSIPELSVHLKDHFNLNIPDGVLLKFLHKLHEYGLIEFFTDGETGLPHVSGTSDIPMGVPVFTSQPSRSENPAGRSRLSRMLYWKVAYLDPDHFFDRLLPKVKFLFTGFFVAFAVVTIFFALYITIANWEEVADQLPTLYSTTTIFWAFILMIPVTVLHEMAHGMTCKYFGGEVHEMGFLFLYFQPSCFCNVSDSYLFKKKGQRIWVMAAGVFFQSFVWAVSTLLWRILTPESWLSHVLFLTIAFTGLVTLFQFNPLLKLDGYYVLAELFAIPNLRAKAFGYLRATLKSILHVNQDHSLSVPRRTRRIFWVYGFVACIYSINFLGYFFLKVERFFVEQYQGTGFILFWGIALFVASEPFAQSIGALYPKTKSEGRSVVVRHKNFLWGSFLFLGGVLFLTLGRWELKVANECTLIPFERAEVRAEVSGTIDQIYLDEGQTVHSGEIIARLAEYKYNGEKSRTLAGINEAQARLQLMLAGPTKEDIALAQSQVDSADAAVKKSEAQIPIARERIDYAIKNYDRLKKMFDEKLLASMSFDEAQRDLNLRRREFEEVQHDIEGKRRQAQEAQKSLAKVMAGTRPEEVTAKRAEIDGLLSQEKLLEVESAYTAIRSPIDGVITTHFLKQKEKSFLQQGDMICEVANTKKILTEIPVPEKEVGDVRVGFPVKLKANAFPTKEFDGLVTQISDKADIRDMNVRVVVVRSEINNPDLLLKPEMTGYAKIYCGKRTIGELLTRRMIRFIRTEFWSWF
jgi:multidrug resistance efflux pump